MERALHPGQGRNVAEGGDVAEDTDDLRAIVVERDGRIVGLIPPRSGLWLEARTNPELWSNALSKAGSSSAATTTF